MEFSFAGLLWKAVTSLSCLHAYIIITHTHTHTHTHTFAGEKLDLFSARYAGNTWNWELFGLSCPCCDCWHWCMSEIPSLVGKTQNCSITWFAYLGTSNLGSHVDYNRSGCAALHAKMVHSLWLVSKTSCSMLTMPELGGRN
jgi:hypothetical protein